VTSPDRLLAVRAASDGEFSRRMLSEWDKIEPYTANGFIAEWPVSARRDR
jgi:hypothetical protein